MRRAKPLPRHGDPVSARQLIELHKTEARASADAMRGLPTTDATQEPPALVELRGVIEERIAIRHRLWAERVQGLEDAVQQDTDTLNTRIKAFVDDVEGEVLQVFADVSAEATLRITEEGSSKSTYAAFRDQRQLFRELMGKQAKLGHFAPLGATTLVEAALQTGLWADVTSQGALGALAMAIGVAGSNAAIGVIGGALPSRALNEPTWWGRAFGIVGVLIAGSLLVGINYLAGKFRDISAAGGDSEATLQIATLLGADWTLTVPGIAVFCFGLANGVFAWVKGYRAFDPVIGFERHARAYQSKVEAVNDLEAHVDGRLSHILNRTVAYGRDRPVAVTTELRQHHREVTALEITQRRHQELDDGDLKALHGAIHAYRVSNLYVRHDGVEPKCLTGEIEVSHHRRDYATLDDLRTDIETALAHQTQAAATWGQHIEAVTAIVTDVKDRRAAILQAIAKHDPKQGLVPELADIRQRFRAMLQRPTEASVETISGYDGGEPWELETSARVS